MARLFNGGASLDAKRIADSNLRFPIEPLAVKTSYSWRRWMTFASALG